MHLNLPKTIIVDETVYWYHHCWLEFVQHYLLDISVEALLTVHLLAVPLQWSNTAKRIKKEITQYCIHVVRALMDWLIQWISFLFNCYSTWAFTMLSDHLQCSHNEVAWEEGNPEAALVLTPAQWSVLGSTTQVSGPPEAWEYFRWASKCNIYSKHSSCHTWRSWEKTVKCGNKEML